MAKVDETLPPPESDLQTEQAARQAELAVGQAHAVAHGGDARGPRAEEQPVDREDRHHRAAVSSTRKRPVEHMKPDFIRSG